MDLKKLREDFPLLNKQINGKPVTYFDNGCVTLRPKQVIEAIVDYYENYPACGGRSLHKLSAKVDQKVAEARELVAKFLNAKRKEEIIFTRNTSEGINLVARSFDFQPGDEVLITDKEHNSNLVPWQVLRDEKGIVLRIIPSNDDGTFSVENYQKLLSEKVKLVSVVYTSNLDGVTSPVSEIIKLAHQHNSLVMLDAAQAVGHKKIDVQKLDVDFLAFSAHKMLGPSGVGVLYGKYDLLNRLKPFLVGGDTVSKTTYEMHEFLPLPERFEAGLQDYAGIIGLGAAVDYLNKLDFDELTSHEQTLNAYITNNIKDIKGLKIIGPTDPRERSGIVSFYIEGVDPHQIAILLDESENIMIRSGQHCVHSWFNARGIEKSARASLYFYNTMEESEKFVESLKKIISILA